jgi:cysteine synthase A
LDIKKTILEAIGNTPLVKLSRVPQQSASDVFVKLEYYNPTGSYKDRMALAMVEGAESEGLLKPGYTVVEYTGGSTGSSLAFVCSVKGYRLKIVTSDAVSEEKKNTMKALGADLTIVPSNGGEVTSELISELMSKAEELGRAPNTYRTNQFYNKHALRGYNKLGKEILEQLDGKVDAFVAAVGTAGCAMGVAEVLKAHNPEIKVFVVEPSESPVISTGSPGAHHIEGIGMGFVPPLLRRDLYDEVLTVREEDAKAMARKLSLEEGIFAGTSTGANVVGALEAAKMLGTGKNVITLAVDTGLKYLSTELYR